MIVIIIIVILIYDDNYNTGLEGIQYLLRPSYGTDTTGGPMLAWHSLAEYSPGMRLGYKIIIV